MEEKKLKKFRGEVFREDRERRNGHKSTVVWLVGLSGSGKSTIAHAVEKRLYDEGIRSYVFDGDNVRHGLCADLSFAPEGRAENVRRIAEVAKLFAENGTICMCAFISPLERDRERVREILGDDYNEVFISCSVEECERRDVKGYYKLAREGKIKNYTGISAPFEEPESADLVIRTDSQSLEESVQELLDFVKNKVFLAD